MNLAAITKLDKFEPENLHVAMHGGSYFVSAANSQAFPIKELDMVRIERVPRNYCRCGCGGLAKDGKKFINGHNKRGKAYHEKQIRRLCECGCGKLANPGKRFIQWHQTRGKNNPFYGKKGKNCHLYGRKGKDHPAYGTIRTEEQKKKMSGENNYMYGKKGKDCPHYGIKRSKKTRNKMSIAKAKMEHTEKSKKKMSIAKSGENNPNFGKQRLGETREKISLSLIGEKSPNWRGGIADDPYCPIFSDHEFKNMIFERDGYECQNPLCRKNCDHLPLVPHHINYNKMDCDLENIITVCWSCNSRANHNRKFWQRHYERIMEDKIRAQMFQGWRS